MSLLHLVASLGLLLGAVVAHAAAPLYPPMQPPWTTLVDEGRPLCEIRLPAEPNPGEARAAEELAAYLQTISAANVPVVRGPGSDAAVPIVVTTDSALPDEALEIRCDSHGLRLAGGGQRGVLYACYAFLEECLGVRWFFDELGEVVPQLRTIRVGTFQRREAPAMAVRSIGRGDWAARNRMNVDLPVAAIKMLHAGHGFDQIIPPKQYFDAHPEFFSYSTVKEARTQRQLCTSNPQLVAEVVKNLRQALNHDPEIKLVGISPNDGSGFCECPNCRALDEEQAGRPSVLEVNRRWLELGPERRGALSRRMVVFAAQVARDLGQSHPDVLVKIFVYNSYSQPPADPAIRCPDNLVVQLCHNTCHGHPYGEAPCRPNAEFRDYLAGWQRIAQNVMLYDYYHKGAAMGLPWPMAHTIRVDLPYLAHCGVKAFYTQYRPDAAIGLNFYLAAKLAWNPAADSEALLADYFEKLYGPAAEPMRRCQEQLDRAVAESKLHPCGVSDSKYLFLADFYRAEVLDRCFKAIAEAKSATEDRTVRSRIAVQEASLRYAELMRDYFIAATAAGQAAEADRKAAFATARQRAEAIEAFLKSREGKTVHAPKLKAFLRPEAVAKRQNENIANAW